MHPGAGASPRRRLDTLQLKEATFELVVDVAVREARGSLPSAVDVSASLALAGGVDTTAYTREYVLELDMKQYATGSGPCLQAISDGHIHDVPSTKDDTAFPAFTAACVQRGVLSVLSLPLPIEKSPVGSLNFYAQEPEAFVGVIRDEAKRLAHEASLLLTRVHVAFGPDVVTEQLQEAVETRDVIGTAKGILMEREGVSIEEAFQMLVRVSQTRNVKLREIARQIVAQHGGA